jgi:GTP1/Obg family GTP-binding protein
MSDIAKAGRLLATPPLPHHFDNEEEMRRVYSLVYDVFRCNLQALLQLFNIIKKLHTFYGTRNFITVFTTTDPYPESVAS